MMGRKMLRDEEDSGNWPAAGEPDDGVPPHEPDEDEGEMRASRCTIVPDKLVWGQQLIQVITFPPSGIGPLPMVHSSYGTNTRQQCAVQLEIWRSKGTA